MLKRLDLPGIKERFKQWKDLLESQDRILLKQCLDIGAVAV